MQIEEFERSPMLEGAGARRDAQEPGFDVVPRRSGTEDRTGNECQIVIRDGTHCSLYAPNGRTCQWHNGCPFPEATGATCHQCGKRNPDYKDVPGLEGGIGYCSKECDDAWSAAHPGYWTPIEETLPGGRYDGVWENSGLRLESDKS